MGLTTPFEVGQVFINNQGDSAEIIELVGGSKNKPRKAKIKFEDGTVTEVSTPKLNTGSWRNPNKPVICGVGYIGQGTYKSSHKRKASRAYRKWENMIKRCYNPENSSYHNYGGKGVTVCEEWHNFQNFAEWFYKRDYLQYDLTLDKDIKYPESLQGKCYCPEYCCLVSGSVNTEFSLLGRIGVIQRKDSFNYVITDCTDSGKVLYSSKRKEVVETFLNEINLKRLMGIHRSLERSDYVEEDTMKAMRDKIVWLSKITIEDRKKLIEYFSN